MTRNSVLREARTWLGTPYHHRAAVKGAGVDCAQFLIEVYSKVGLAPRIDVGEYPPDWHLHRGDERYTGWVKQHATLTDTCAPGDIALFQFGRCVSHAAIVVEWPVVIHAFFRQGVVYTNANDAELRGRHNSFWTLWGDA